MVYIQLPAPFSRQKDYLYTHLQYISAINFAIIRYSHECMLLKEDTREMERTLSVNYPVLGQNKGVLLNTFEKHHGRKIQHYTSIREARRDR